MKKYIPINKLQERADLGVEVGRISDKGVRERIEKLDVHRDDNFIFLLFERGNGSAIIDFVTMPFPAGHIYYISPGQVHHNIRTNGGEAYFVSVSVDLVPKGYRQVFEGNLTLQLPCKLEPDELYSFQGIMQLLYEQFRKDHSLPFYYQLLHSLLQSFLCLFARIYFTQETDVKRTSRLFQITQQFKRLISEKIKSEKSPAFYAAALNISEVYLNQAVKSSTGFNVTFWLMNEVMLEAKRLLFYSQLNVNEIAYQLGYEDHTYFSRLFKKQHGLSPSHFRDSYLK